MLKKFFNQVNIFRVCRQQYLPLHLCPQFLFLIMGLINIVILITSFLIGTQYISDPTLVALIDSILAILLIIITFIITECRSKSLSTVLYQSFALLLVIFSILIIYYKVIKKFLYNPNFFQTIFSLSSLFFYF